MPVVPIPEIPAAPVLVVPVPVPVVPVVPGTTRVSFPPEIAVPVVPTAPILQVATAAAAVVPPSPEAPVTGVKPSVEPAMTPGSMAVPATVPIAPVVIQEAVVPVELDHEAPDPLEVPLHSEGSMEAAESARGVDVGTDHVPEIPFGVGGIPEEALGLPMKVSALVRQAVESPEGRLLPAVEVVPLPLRPTMDPLRRPFQVVGQGPDAAHLPGTGMGGDRRRRGAE